MKVIAISGYKRSGKDTAANLLIEKGGFTRVAFADPLKDSVALEYGIPREHCDDPKFKEAPIMSLPVIPKDEFTLNLSKALFKEFRAANGGQALNFTIDRSGAFMGVLNYDKGLFSAGETLGQLYHTPRSLCILKGSVNRFVRSDYWVKAAIDSIKSKEIGAVRIMNPLDAESINRQISEMNASNKFVISDLRYRSEVDQLRQAFGKDLITVRVNRFDTVESTDPSERDLDNIKLDVIIENKGTIEEFQTKIEELLNGTKS